MPSPSSSRGEVDRVEVGRSRDGKLKRQKKNCGAGTQPQERERHNIERGRGLTGSRQERWHLSDGQRWEAQERDPRIVVILSPEVDEAARIMEVD